MDSQGRFFSIGAVLVAGFCVVVALEAIPGWIPVAAAKIPVTETVNLELKIAVLILLGAVGLLAILFMLFTLSSGNGFELESHWGGLGGGLGGWRISAPATMLLIALACLGGAVCLVAQPAKSSDDKPLAKSDSASAATDSDSEGRSSDAKSETNSASASDHLPRRATPVTREAGSTKKAASISE